MRVTGYNLEGTLCVLSFIYFFSKIGLLLKANNGFFSTSFFVVLRSVAVLPSESFLALRVLISRCLRYFAREEFPGGLQRSLILL